jgi:hypothetical protein
MGHGAYTRASEAATQGEGFGQYSSVTFDFFQLLMAELLMLILFAAALV